MTKTIPTWRDITAPGPKFGTPSAGNRLPRVGKAGHEGSVKRASSERRAAPSILRLHVLNARRDRRAPSPLYSGRELIVVLLHGGDQAVDEERIVRGIDVEVSPAVPVGDARKNRGLAVRLRGKVQQQAERVTQQAVLPIEVG